MTKELVHTIVKQAQAYKWSIQGFGMLRLHITDEYRLNIWNDAFRVPNVSLIHTHPWNFESLVVVGTLRNVRFFEDSGTPQFSYAEIKPGPGGGLLKPLGQIALCSNAPEVYSTGEWYQQKHQEIHMSLPKNGTVTLNKRQRVGEDIAHVFWESSTSWVSAEPRTATAEEIAGFVQPALELFK